jgi:hypothetical protein
MTEKRLAGHSEDFKPDILIPYSIDREILADSAISVISVRPETNKVNYEAVIIQSIEPYAQVIYMANLSGSLLNKKAIIASHYSSQLKFALNGKEELKKYPQMQKRFEEKFNITFQKAKIIGSYEAIIDYKLRKNADELFSIMVPEEDFLEMYGQTIKKIGDYFVLNYDIPAVITRHHSDTAVFIIAIRLKSSKYRFYGIHHLIYQNMRKNKAVSFIDLEKRKYLPWYDQVRRTYHISRSHIEAMFDLTDYVFKTRDQCILFSETPLGQKLLQEKVFDEQQLEVRLAALKENPLVYIKQENNESRLANIIREGKTRKGPSFIEKDLDECTQIIKRIDWEKSFPGNSDF